MKTVAAMIRIACRDRHGPSAALCGECLELHDYAMARLRYCRFGEDKPTCARCPVHCYKPDMRERIRTVMRQAGPKMALRHPWLTLRHFLKERSGDGGLT